jgi:hypothetical protein
LHAEKIPSAIGRVRAGCAWPEIDSAGSEFGYGRWTILGIASEVYVSHERAAVLDALGKAGADGLAVPEIMAATGSNSRGAMDTLLFKMKEGGEIVRVKRGIYALPQDGGKIGQKERIGVQGTENK